MIMRPWLYRHRYTVYALYIAIMVTLTVILQYLDSTGRI